MRFNKFPLLIHLLVALTSVPLSGPAPAQEPCCVWAVNGEGVAPCDCSYCAPAPLYIRAEYLHAWINDGSLPALFSTSSLAGDQTDAGVLGEPGTRVLFGDEAVGGESRGVRGTFGLRLGHYFDCLADWQVETTVMWLGSSERPNQFLAVSDGDPILARPFFDTSNGAQNAGLTAYPGLVVGGLAADISNEVNSACILARRILHWNQAFRLDLLAGYRYFNYSEELVLDQAFLAPSGVASGQLTYVEIFDGLRTRSRFDGFELGALTRYSRQAWEFELLGKLALGRVQHTTNTAGATTLEDLTSGDTVALAQGFLASPAQIGTTKSNEFAV
jgi:hypothetical protein